MNAISAEALELAPVGRVRTLRALQDGGRRSARSLPPAVDEQLLYDGDDSEILDDGNDWANWPDSGASLLSG